MRLLLLFSDRGLAAATQGAVQDLGSLLPALAAACTQEPRYGGHRPVSTEELPELGDELANLVKVHSSANIESFPNLQNLNRLIRRCDPALKDELINLVKVHFSAIIKRFSNLNELRPPFQGMCFCAEGRARDVVKVAYSLKSPGVLKGVSWRTPNPACQHQRAVGAAGQARKDAGLTPQI